MPILTTPSGAFPISLIYITVGTLVDIWTVVAMIYYPPETDWGRFLVVGSFITGLALLIIGLFLGHIGRAARNAELPPADVTPAVASAEQTAAANPPAVISQPTATPPGSVVVPPAQQKPAESTMPIAGSPHGV
jgi:hypothetical protein